MSGHATKEAAVGRPAACGFPVRHRACRQPSEVAASITRWTRVRPATRHNGVVYAWLRRPVPGLWVARGDLLLALALTVATVWLAEAEVGDLHGETQQVHIKF